MLTIVAGTIFVSIFTWWKISNKWTSGINFLLFYLVYGGVISLWLSPSTLPLLFKDIFFVIPLYLSFGYQLLAGRHDTNLRGFPKILYILIGILTLAVLISSLNNNIPNSLVAGIGIKVWLLYIPLVFVSYAFLETKDDLIRLLRMMVIISWPACIFGIALFALSGSVGYRAVITAVYGDLASSVTQQFTFYDFGASLFRIPSTFVSWYQYATFGLAMIVPTYALWKLDPKRRWRGFAFFSMLMVIAAAFTSGAKANFLFVPLMLGFAVIFEGNIRGGILMLFLAPLVFFTFFIATGIEFDSLYDLMARLADRYIDEVVVGGLVEAIERAPFGLGVGMNTGPARHAFDNPALYRHIENYYAKSVIELGIPGLILVLTLFGTLILISFRRHLRVSNSKLRGSSAVILAFVIVVTLHSFKGWMVDVDPVNVYFWLFLGLLFKLPLLADTHSTKSSENRRASDLPRDFRTD